MKVIRDLKSFSPPSFPVVTSGSFDGVHLAHQEIISYVQNIAKAENGQTVILTFWPHPRQVLYPDNKPVELITTLDEKIELLSSFGIDYLFIIPFDKKFAEKSSEEFINEILVNTMHTKHLVLGYDHRFGKNREGSFDYLMNHQAKYNFEISEIPRQKVEETTISSSTIRKYLHEGKVKLASIQLGRYYTIHGKVINGNKIGRKLGYPTANIEILSPFKLIPMSGVYAVTVIVKGTQYPAMLNIGNRPTIDNNSKRSIEAHIFDFSHDIYDEDISIQFKKFIRNEVKFENLDKLKEQLKKDETTARNALNTI